MSRNAGIGVLLVVGLSCGCLAAASPLDDVLQCIPLDLTDPMILFTDWGQIKTALGLDWLTSDGPAIFREELVLRTTRDQAAGSAYGLSTFRNHAEQWGWDTADLEWEANVYGSEIPPTYILKLRDGFDFASISIHFEARGFVQTESRCAVVYSHALAIGEDWVRTTELSIHNTAYLPPQNLMILSSQPGGVEALLATLAGELPSLDEDPFATAAVSHLDDPAAAAILLGLGECLGFTPNPILDLIGTVPTEEDIDEIRAAIEERQLLVPYRAFAVGYRTIDHIPVGTIVFEYDAAELAALDLPFRQSLAETGTSASYDTAIADVYFAVIDASVDGSAIVLTVAPVDDRPRRLFDMIFRRDAPFAGCSG